jgi:hypothetical protein
MAERLRACDAMGLGMTAENIRFRLLAKDSIGASVNEPESVAKNIPHRISSTEEKPAKSPDSCGRSFSAKAGLGMFDAKISR